MPLLTLKLSRENVKNPARKHFEKTNKERYVLLNGVPYIPTIVM